jgi:hypothetical protein
VIRGVEVCRCDLESPAKGKPDSPPQTKSTKDEAGRHKILLLTIVLSILEKCGV